MTISSTLELRDNFSNTMNNIANAANNAVAAMEKMREIMEVSTNNDAFKSMRAAIDNTNSSMRSMEATVQDSVSETNEFTTAVDNMNFSLRSMETAAQGSMSETDEFAEAVGRTEVAATATEQASRRLGDSIRQTGDESHNAAGGFMSTADSISQMLIAAGGYKVLGFVKDGLTEAASAAIEFESAVTGIYKTVDGSREQLQGLSNAVREMSTQMPATTTEIAGVMEAAGQLGIATDNVTEFSETMINLGESTNLTSDAAASMLAKFANVTQMDPSNYSNLGSAIVALGNNFATTEADIANMSSYLASAATLAGFSQTDILGLSAAMSSVGIEAEAGGSAMSKLITEMQIAVETGDGLTDFAQTANMTVQEFSDTFKNDAVVALQSFITGLNDVERNGASASVILQQMDLDDIRLSNTIRALASSNGLMSDAVNTANTAWSENTALANEAEKRYSTLESKLQMTKNSANNLKIAVGDALTPALGKANDAVKGVLDKFSDFAKNNKAVTAGVTAFAGSIGVTVGGLTTAIPVVSQATQAFTALKSSMTMKIAAQQGISVAEAAVQAGSQLRGVAGKLGLVAGGISLAIGLTAGLVTAFSNAKDKVEDYNGTLEQCRGEIESTSTALEAAKDAYGENSNAVKTLAENLDTLNAQYIKGGGAVEEYAQRVQESQKKINDNINEYRGNISSVDNKQIFAVTAVSQLQTLSEKAQITNSDLGVMSRYADYLNNTFNCNIVVDYDMKKLVGFNPDSAFDTIQEKAKQNKIEYAIDYITDGENLINYQNSVENMLGARSTFIDLIKSSHMGGLEDYSDASLETASTYFNDGKQKKAYDNYIEQKEAVEKAEAEYRAAFKQAERSGEADDFLRNTKSNIKGYNKYEFERDFDKLAWVQTPDEMFGNGDNFKSIKEVSDIFDTIIEKNEDVKDALTPDDAIAQGLTAVSDEIMNAAAAYDEMYQAAYESFSGQYGIFENASDSYKKTVSEITGIEITDIDEYMQTADEIEEINEGVIQSFIDSANSQADYFNTINNSINTLSQATVSEIGISRQEWDDFVDYASQLPQTAGEEGAAAVNAFADAINSGDYSKVKEAVRAWQDNETAMQTTSKNIGYEVSDMKQTLNVAEFAVSNTLRNIGERAPVAHQKAQSVIDQLAAGVSAGYANLNTQVTAVENLMSRLTGFNVSVKASSKGEDVSKVKETYATGTLSAAPGLALVGETGPELVNFGGGEVVYTANQTRQILSDMSRPYMPQMKPMNIEQPEVIVNIPAINVDLGRKNKKYEAAEYYTQILPSDDEKPDISDDDVKYLRELAEREAINKIYQPQITNKIEMTNSVSSDADLDEIVHSLATKLIDTMAVTAEGVHD